MAPDAVINIVSGQNTCNFSYKASYFSRPFKFSVSRSFDGGLNPASLSCLCKMSFDISENTSMDR